MAVGAVLTKNGFNSGVDRMFNSATAISVPSRFSIGTGTTTPTETDTGIETIIAAWNAGSNFKDYVTGYPSYDTANQRVTVQGFISSTQANANSITEVADMNTDGTPIAFTHIVTSAISKTNKTQIYITTTFGRT